MCFNKSSIMILIRCAHVSYVNTDIKSHEMQAASDLGGRDTFTTKTIYSCISENTYTNMKIQLFADN